MELLNRLICFAQPEAFYVLHGTPCFKVIPLPSTLTQLLLATISTVLVSYLLFK